MTGEITASYKGTEDITSAAFLALLEALDTGAATQGADITTFHIVPHGDGQASVFTCARTP